MVVPPKYCFHAINVQQLIYVLYNKKCKWYFLSQYFLSVCSSICAGTFCVTIVLHIKKTCKEHLKFWGQFCLVHSLDTLWVENFDKIALSRTVKEIQAILCLPFLAKIQNGRHFWGGENFWKIDISTFLRYPVGRKFRRNRSISHG